MTSLAISIAFESVMVAIVAVVSTVRSVSVACFGKKITCWWRGRGGSGPSAGLLLLIGPREVPG